MCVGRIPDEFPHLPLLHSAEIRFPLSFSMKKKASSSFEKIKDFVRWKDSGRVSAPSASSFCRNSIPSIVSNEKKSVFEF